MTSGRRTSSTIDHARAAERAYRSGQLAAAREQILLHLKRNRKDGRAHAFLAQVEYDLGLPEEARRAQEKAIKLLGRDAKLLHQYGRILAELGETDAAVDALDRALQLEPDHAAAQFTKALALERAGRVAEARAILTPLLDGSDVNPQMIAAAARLDSAEKQHDAAIRRLDEALESPRATGGARQLLLFTLGKACDKAGRYDRAFAACAEGNRINAPPFHPDEFKRFIDELIELFDDDWASKLPRAANSSELPVVIAGMPRSGTTLIEQIIDAHPEGAGAGELTDISRRADELSHRPGGYPAALKTIAQQELNGFASSHLSHLRAIAPKAQRIVNKALDNWQHLGFIAMLLPKARVIFSGRDPMDTCLSCFMSNMIPARHPYISDLSHLGFVYREHERLLAHWKDVLDLPMHAVVYEQLVNDQQAQTRALIEFLGLAWDDRCLRFHESGRTVMTLSYDQVTRPMYTTAQQRWKNYAKHLAPLREALDAAGEGA